RGTLEILLNCGQRLLASKLALSETKAERAGAYEAHWRRLKRIEAVNLARYRAGRIPVQDYANTKYHRLEPEVLFSKAKNGLPQATKGGRQEKKSRIAEALTEEVISAYDANSRLALSAIQVAFSTYWWDHQHYPPAAIYSNEGKPLLSWRVLLLPYFF